VLTAAVRGGFNGFSGLLSEWTVWKDGQISITWNNRTGMPEFEKGQSGNPGGRPKRQLFTEALRIQALRPVELDESGQPKLPELPNNPRQIDVIANTLIVEARTGENRTQAIKEIRDTLQGKPAQSLEHSGMIASTHEELLKQLDNETDDADGESDTPPA
jgi:hypothetical protein